ncbi:MAG: carbohydrate ABC transporter permease [Clostridia bacterium]|nr:carbohydrate ABC transporter permease [Clostridia bacterium]
MNKKARNFIGYGLLYTGMIFFGFVAMLPFVWMVRSSFMEIKQIFLMPPRWIPEPFTVNNFTQAFHQTHILRNMGNTLYVVIMNIIGVELTSSMAAYAFSRVHWKGRDTIFAVLLSAMMLPGTVTLIPVYIGWSKVGGIDTYWPLILGAFLGGGAYNIFLMRQFFLTIPHELDEAAFIDGASRFRIYWNIDIPLAKSSLIVVGLFTFMGTWNDFMGPLLYINNLNKQTVAVALQSLLGKYTSQWNIIMAASVIVTLPCFFIFLIGQKYIVGGIALSGIKG